MSSEPRGIGTSTVEVTNITAHGVWLLAGERELFMPHAAFPFFKDVAVAKILNVEEAAPGHFHWPDLDVDLGIETIENPDRFPLVAEGDPLGAPGMAEPIAESSPRTELLRTQRDADSLRTRCVTIAAESDSKRTSDGPSCEGIHAASVLPGVS